VDKAHVNTPEQGLSAPVTRLPGVGPERAAQLARLQVVSISDLLLHRPLRYEDRRRFRPIADLRLGQGAAVRGKVVALGVKWYRQHTRSIFELILSDGTARLHCRWWQMPFMEKYFRVDQELLAFGKPISLKPRTLDHPEIETFENGEDSLIHLNRVVPVYPLTEGLPQRWLRALLWRALERFEPLLAERWPGVDLAGLPAFRQAVRDLHFPAEIPHAERARQRLALDEFIALQLSIQRRRKNLQAHARGLPCGGDNRLVRPLLQQLGFKLTGAQTRVLRELRRDLAGQFPMRRLLQGDVGSGKTIVAACCALMALESGFNVALMAPTEILAEQHALTFRRWFEPLGVPVHLRTGAHDTLPKDGQPDLFKAAPQPQGEPKPNPTLNSQLSTLNSLVIGTHALIQSAFALERLGLVIIDEQHKFGVVQREELVRKGHYPHLLVMTATPIPRTLGLTLYGDLDLSVIDELPPGRGRVRTFVRATAQLPKVWDFIKQKIAEGRQAYIVYPRAEQEDPRAGLKAVTREFELVKQALAPHRVALVHGRLKPQEKQQVMEAFRGNQAQALVATSIIEVGVDVPNATVMLVENADQFGLAQLHQLRGRIGRGAHESFCILVAGARTPEAKARLKVLEDTTDGFKVAEADLQLRGPGELLGVDQSGLPSFRFGNLAGDLALVERARALAARLLEREGGAA
jgi:ATP-dependent DNA helicase RecG